MDARIISKGAKVRAGRRGTFDLDITTAQWKWLRLSAARMARNAHEVKEAPAVDQGTTMR